MTAPQKTQRDLFEAAVIERMKESGFLEVEIRVECLARCDDGYQDEVINAGWHYWNAALSAAEPVFTIVCCKCDTALNETDLERRMCVEDGEDCDACPKCGTDHHLMVRPLYSAPPASSVAVKALEAHVLEDFTHLTKDQSVSGPYIVKRIKERFASSALSAQVQANKPEWEKLDEAFSNFINAYGDPFKPKRNHEKETEKNVKALSEAFIAFRSAQLQFDADIAAAINLGATVLSRIADPAAREIAIRNALVVASNRSAQVQDVAGWQLVPKDDERRCVADSALPHEMIEAGIRVQEQVNDDNCNYVAGETTDWDCGMVAVAIYRAMLAAAPAKQEGKP